MSSYPGSMKGRSTGNTVPETGPAGRGAPGMTASKASQPADAAPAAQRRRRRPAVRRIVHVVLFIALAAGVFGLLPRLGGLTRDAAELRHARPAFVVAAVVAQAISLACYALLYRRVLASLGGPAAVLGGSPGHDGILPGQPRHPVRVGDRNPGQREHAGG